MNLNAQLLASAVFGALVVSTPASAAQTINFETTGAGNPTVINGSVGTDYSSLGVTFTDAFYKRCGGGCPDPSLGTFVSSANFSSPFSLNFLGTTSAFSFSNVSNSSGTASAFGTGGNLLQTINFSEFPQSFSFSTAGIKSVSFSGPGFGVDNFAFADVTGPTAPVPEPATWAMMLLGFGFVGSAMRSVKRRQKAVLSYA